MKLEILEKDSYYHIYNRGNNSETIFIDDENKSYFLRLFAKHLNDLVDVYAYCLMDNQFHFIVKVNKDEEKIIQGFSNFFNAYAKAFNKQNDRTGSLFEKHFKRIKLHDEGYLKNLILYIHLNPKHHLDLNFDAYKFSSYQSFLTHQESKIKKEEVLKLFGGIENFMFCHHQKNDLLTEKYTFE